MHQQPFFFAVATVFNINLLQGNSVGDVTLDDIAVMAQANNEHPCTPNYDAASDANGNCMCLPNSEPDSGAECCC